ncbi:MAG: ATP-dependent helicase, partial [Candidatus Natronoplasma sp.]
VHRIGRTGRLGKEGKAVTFVSRDEVEFLGRIEDFVESELKELEIEEEGRVKHRVDYDHQADLFGMVSFKFSLNGRSMSRWDIEKRMKNYGIKPEDATIKSLEDDGGVVKIVKSKAERVPKMDFFDHVELVEREGRKK